MVGSAPSCGWTLAAESLVIVREDSGVPRTLKSLVFFDCASPPLGTSSPLRSPSPSFAVVGDPSIHEHSCLRDLSPSPAGIRAFCWYFIGIKARFGRRYQHAQR